MSKNVIIHGDSRDYIPKIQTPINMVLTDPPYGMDYTSNSATRPDSLKFTEKIAADGNVFDAIKLFHSIMGPICAKMADECEIYIFTAWHVLEWWIPAVKALTFLDASGEQVNWWRLNDDGSEEPGIKDLKFDNGIRLKQMLIWDKGSPGQGDVIANWGCGHEVILYLKKGRRPIPKRRSGIITCPRVPSGKNIHPTEKPLGILRPLIEMSTDPGDFIVEPFSGSGSTSAAAQELNRNSLAFEIDERWIARSQERLESKSIFNME